MLMRDDRQTLKIENVQKIGKFWETPCGCIDRGRLGACRSSRCRWLPRTDNCLSTARPLVTTCWDAGCVVEMGACLGIVYVRGECCM
jgi:hypothetical protein